MKKATITRTLLITPNSDQSRTMIVALVGRNTLVTFVNFKFNPIQLFRLHATERPRAVVALISIPQNECRLKYVSSPLVVFVADEASKSSRICPKSIFIIIEKHRHMEYG